MSEAVILMAYGSPERLADVPAYYADIRGGRPIARCNKVPHAVLTEQALGLPELRQELSRRWLSERLLP